MENVRKSVSELVKEQKQNGENTEFYPTTQEIVNEIVADMEKRYSYYDKVTRLLDIGCGNGSFFEKFDIAAEKLHYNNNLAHRYGIEKSQTLLNNLHEKVIILGTEFHEQSLIDKEMDVIFCNPPYSEYEEWAEKIILEGNAKYIYLVIPDRWESSQRIKTALERRDIKTKVLGSFDFLQAERKARANVHIVRLTIDKNREDAFDLWFNSTFNLSCEEKKFDSETEQVKIEKQLVEGDIIEQLVKFYNADMEKLYNNYKAIETLDASILKELNVDIKTLKEGLKQRIKGLKNLYWKTLFSRYDKVTSRLTSKIRSKILGTINENTVIDFTISNIMAVTLWVIKNANKYYDEQLKDYFERLANPESIRMYKSNKRYNEDDWRYVKQEFERGFSHDKKRAKNYMLDYRIVYKGYKNFDGYTTLYLSDETYELLEDTLIIAKNLGFKFGEVLKHKYDEKAAGWNKRDILYADGKVFCNVKLYGNGNKHFKFDTEFMKRLNLEASRLNGWVTDKEEAAEELGLNLADVSRIWGRNAKIGINAKNILQLECC